MAAAEILATGSTAFSSSDVTVVAGTPLTVALKGAAASAEVIIKLKDDAGGYNPVGVLDPSDPATLISAPGTYRFTRVVGAACGVFSA